MGSAAKQIAIEAPAFEEAKVNATDTEIKTEVGETPIEPTELNTDTLTLNDAPGRRTGRADRWSGRSGLRTSRRRHCRWRRRWAAWAALTSVRSGPGSKVRGAGQHRVRQGDRHTRWQRRIGHGLWWSRHWATPGDACFRRRHQAKRTSRRGCIELAGSSSESGRRLGARGCSAIAKNPSCRLASRRAAMRTPRMSPPLPWRYCRSWPPGQTHKTKGPYQKTIFGGLYGCSEHQKSDEMVTTAATPCTPTAWRRSPCAKGIGSARTSRSARQHSRPSTSYPEANPKGGGWQYTHNDQTMSLWWAGK